MAFHPDQVLALLRDSAARGASELHFKVPNRPTFRIGGRLLPAADWTVTPEIALQVGRVLASLAEARLALLTTVEATFSFGFGSVGRLQVHLYRQRGSLGVVVQRVGSSPPSLLEVGLPAEAEALPGQPGLMLVAGPQRAQVLAAFVDAYNACRRGYVVVLEAPLTHLHRDGMARIAHREVGVDVASYQVGIQQAMRTGADLLVVGDVEDALTAEAVLLATERGLSVLAGVAASDPADAAWAFARNFYGELRSDVEERVGYALSRVCVVPRGDRPQIVELRGAA